MPHKKRRHGGNKTSKEKGETSQNVPQTSRFQSQQVTPTSTSQVSTVKPAQYEKGSTQSSSAAVAAKPGPAPSSGAGGAVGTTTTPKGTTQVTQQATVSKPTSSSSANIPSLSSGAGTMGPKSTDPAQDKAQSTTTPSSKPGPAKVDPAVGKPSASATLPGSGLKEKSGQKVQVEVGPSAPKVSAEADPFDALGDLLPSSQPVAPKIPKYTGPEVKETNIKPEKGVLCGEKDSTLPPGYRWEDLEKKKPSGVPEKPKEVPKPISTDEALDSLSVGFVSAPPKKTEPRTETIGAVDAKSAGLSNFSPPPPYQPKQQATTTAGVTKSPAPPADKKAKIETPGEKSTLAAGKSSTPAQPAKPKTDVSDSSIPSDALNALGDMLGDPEPPKKQPELKPGARVDEKKVKSEKGVRVGEREDTLPPDYRFNEEELKKLPPPPKEPSMDTDEALDILSGGFESRAAAPVVKAAVPPIAPSAQGKKKPAGVPEKAKEVPKPKVDELSALDALACEFVAPAKTAPKVSSAAPPEPKQKKPSVEDPFDALGDTLGAPEPPKKQPELKPGDIVHEKGVTSKKGVRVGEREDTLPPDYRFSKEELKKFPAPPKEPSLDTDEALDLLSGGFNSPSVPSAPKLPVCTSAKAPAKPSDDFVAPSSASKVQSAVPGPTHVERQLSEGSSALDALSDTLADIKPTPKPEPALPKTIVKEKVITEERVTKPGERDDTLPPDHRFSEADKKAFAEAKEKSVKPKKGSMDDAAALDLLSSEFSSTPTVKPSAPEAHTFKPEPTPPTHAAPGPALDELANKLIPDLEKSNKAKAPGPALDELANKLIPDLEKSNKAKGKGGKPKSKSKKQSGEDSSAVEHLSGQLSSKNVVPSSSSKSGKR